MSVWLYECCMYGGYGVWYFFEKGGKIIEKPLARIDTYRRVFR